MGSILLSLWTGLLPLALAGSLVGLWAVIAGDVSMTAILATGADLLSFSLVIATVRVFRVTIKASYAQPAAPTNVTPFAPRPVGPGAGLRVHR
ncbi:hypothetical protein [Marinovum sp.]|uniref:hypothetical protein n=1 Tax=Marinovum sp. TaxID=2024839 RepID=UPI002B267673|nr:hypothetical protein [Marinovum sp.]